MTTLVTPTSHGAEHHAAGLAVCGRLHAALWPHRDDPAVARILGLRPATNTVPPIVECDPKLGREGGDRE